MPVIGAQAQVDGRTAAGGTFGFARRAAHSIGVLGAHLSSTRSFPASSYVRFTSCRRIL